MPHFWIMLGRYDKDYDTAINCMIDNSGDNITFDIHTAEAINTKRKYYVMTVGVVKIWVANYPYAYGTPWCPPERYKFRPSRDTIMRLREFEKKEYKHYKVKCSLHKTFNTLYK